MSVLHRWVAAFFVGGMVIGLSSCSGVIGLPVSGPVRELTPTEQHSYRVFTSPAGPSDGMQPEAIVKGLLDAMPAGVQSDGFATARQFLTETCAKRWRADSRTVIYNDVPQITRKASTIKPSLNVRNKTLVTVEMRVRGYLDAHGIYSPVSSGTIKKYDLILSKTQGQWRIDEIPDGSAVSTSDFDQVFREVALYWLSSSQREFIPDVRWFCWRDWRTQAIRELLDGEADWLKGAVSRVDGDRVSLDTEEVTFHDSKTYVGLSSGLQRLTASKRGILIRQIRLSLGDGSPATEIKVTSGNKDFSHADANAGIDNNVSLNQMYTLSAGNIISLKSSSAIRVAQAGLMNAKSLVFSPKGGAVLREEGVVDRLGPTGETKGRIFAGLKVRAIARGLLNEIWAIDSAGKRLLVDDGHQELTLDIPNLKEDQSVGTFVLSPEGDRVAFSIVSDNKDLSGMGLIAICRDRDGKAKALSQSFKVISTQSDISMMTFYNDATLIYATAFRRGLSGQHAYRQLAPGVESSQELPDGGAVDLATGEVNMFRRLTVLDGAGTARVVDGSLEGPWSIADSQVSALSRQ